MPLIDVLLVLIIIFMVITPQVPAGLPALVPQAAPPESRQEPTAIVVQVMQGGKLINQHESDWNTLADLSHLGASDSVKYFGIRRGC